MTTADLSPSPSTSSAPGSADAAQRIAADLARLLAAIGEGRALDAFERFYAPDVRMQENELPPTIGFPANLARERAFHASIASWQEFTVLAHGVSDRHSFYECVMRWTTLDGTPVRVRQVAVAAWKDGRIVEERFVYG